MTRLSKASHARRGAMEMDHNRSKYIKVIFLEILAVWCHFESRFLYNRATIRQGSSSFLFSLSFSFSSQSLGSPQRTGAEVRRWCHSWSLSIRFFWSPHLKSHRKAVSKPLDSEDPDSESESEPFSWGENWGSNSFRVAPKAMLFILFGHEPSNFVWT